MELDDATADPEDRGRPAADDSRAASTAPGPRGNGHTPGGVVAGASGRGAREAGSRRSACASRT